jgi:UDP-N-acetylmuramate--alanine ligase
MNIHMIGIGGIGTSALARIFNEKGHKMTGSDMEDSDLIKELKAEGIEILLEHKKENLPKECDLVVYSEAIPKGNVELKEAEKRNIKIQTYFEALGELSGGYKTIAVCGSHGKTTVTAMIAKILLEAGQDPTVVIGTKMQELGNKNYRLGKSKWMVVEACEYKRSFLHLHPDIIVMTNLEYEHPDYYKDYEDYKQAFEEFFARMPGNGELITGSKPFLEELNVPGEFNKLNAGLALELGEHLQIDFPTMLKSLKDFKGTWRRFEIKGNIGDTVIIDDYAHHPTEIKATLKATREKWPYANILCIFQPHQYSRTYTLLNDFAESFKDTDKVVIPNIYKVRDSEEAVRSVSPEKLVEEINKVSENAEYGNGLENVIRNFRELIKGFDIVIAMGAGDVWKITDLSLK